MSTSSANNAGGAVSLIGRILLAAIFVVSGLGKLAAAGATQGYIASVGLPAPMLVYLVAVVVELGGGVLLLIGYRTRPAALALAVFSVVAAALFHHALGDQNQFIHFLKNLAIAGGLLQVVAFGPGLLSVDNRRAAATARGYAA
jgi:putative oxidoreductase